MENDFKNILFAFILIGLFGVLILSAVISFSGTYSKDYSDVVGGSLALDKFNDSISDIGQQAQDFQTRFEKQSIWSALAGVVVTGVFSITIDMINIVLAPFNLVANIMIDLFGVPVYVTGIILALLILSIIFALWRLYKIGA